MKIAHVVIASRSRRALARDESERRALVRALARVTAGRLLLFNLVDDHLHAVVRAPWPGRMGDVIHRVLRARRPDLKLKRPHVEPVGDQDHLLTLVKYVIRQTARHQLGAASGPAMALWTGSCVQDLLGVRVLPGFDAAPLRSELPRLGQRHLVELVGLPVVRIDPADDLELARLGPASIVELAAAVWAVGPELRDKSPPSVAARALALRVASLVGIPLRATAGLLGVGVRAAEKLARRDVSPRALTALRRRLTLEQRIAEARRPAVAG